MIQLIGGVIHISSCIFQLDLVCTYKLNNIVIVAQILLTLLIFSYNRIGFETPRHTYAIGCDLRYMELYQHIYLLFFRQYCQGFISENSTYAICI